MNTIATERAAMEKQFPEPPDQAWYDALPNPPQWELFEDGFKGKRVLDFGCASGWLGWKVQLAGGFVKALDIFKGYCHPQLEFMEFNGCEIPFETGYFDFVITTNTLHHLADMKLGVAEIGRVLKPGGKFISFQEPVIPNAANEQQILHESCQKELDAGICERRPDMATYRAAFHVDQWVLDGLFDSSGPIWTAANSVKVLRADLRDYSGGIGIIAIRK